MTPLIGHLRLFTARAIARGLAAIVTTALLAVHAPACADEGVNEVDVKVERVRPQKEKHPTLRFLKENRDFIRARFDLLREKSLAHRGEGGEVDPRFLAYREMLASIAAASDSTASADEAQRKLELLASVTQLGDLESRLDLLERLLHEQRGRLGVLQEDFTGDQRTALMVVLSGYPSEVELTAVTVKLEDGGLLTVPLSPEQQDALRQGGVVEVFHGFVEPREQVVEVAITGERWPAGDSGFVTLEPARDRLTLLRLDVSTVRPEAGAPSIHASTWLHDAGTPSTGG